MKYVIANTQDICKLSEGRLEEFLKNAKPAIYKKDGKLLFAYKHGDTLYRFSGSPLDYRTWRELFHKSPRFRGMVFSLFAMFGKAQDVESSEILEELLTDPEGERTTYWLLQKIMGENTHLLSEESVREGLKAALWEIINSKGKGSNTKPLADALLREGVPSSEVESVVSKFDPTKSQIVTINDAKRMLNNISPIAKLKYSDEEVEKRLQKASDKITALEKVINPLSAALVGKSAAEVKTIKAKAVDALVASGMFTAKSAQKYIEMVAPSKSDVAPKSVEQITKPLGSPIVGKKFEPGTPFMHEYYKAFQDFVEKHPEHGPAVARQVARNIFENPSEGLPVNLSDHPYSSSWITQQNEEALKKIASEHEEFLIRTAKFNIVEDESASDDFQSEYGVSLEAAVRIAGSTVYDGAVSELMHHLTPENIRVAGFWDRITDSASGLISEYFSALKDRYSRVRNESDYSRNQRLMAVASSEKYRYIAMLVEGAGFRLSDVNDAFVPEVAAEEYTNKLKQKVSGFGRLFKGIFSENTQNVRTAGVLNGIRDSLADRFVDYFEALRTANAKATSLNRDQVLESVSKKEKYRMLSMILESVGFQKEMACSKRFKAEDQARHYANKVTQKISTMGKIGLGILTALGIWTLSSLPKDNSTTEGGHYEETPYTAPLPFEQYEEPTTKSDSWSGNVRLSQVANLDVLATIENQAKQQIDAIINDPKLKQNPQAMQAAFAQLNEQTAQALQPIYDQIRAKKPIDNLSPKVGDELFSMLQHVAQKGGN